VSRPEKAIRHHAEHIGLVVRRQGDKLVLSERYDDLHNFQKRKLGTFRSWRALDRALWLYHDVALGAGDEKVAAERFMRRLARQRKRRLTADPPWWQPSHRNAAPMRPAESAKAGLASQIRLRSGR
jgi:hypothetical protein